VDQDDDGYTIIVAPPVQVELRNAAGTVLAKTKLGTSFVQGMEGHLRIPDGLDDVLSLVALAEIDGAPVSVERDLYVRESIESRLPAGRAVNAFQVWKALAYPSYIAGSRFGWVAKRLWCACVRWRASASNRAPSDL
jgi:hypothetical protein